MITGYGFGALGQGASYYFISSYFVVFLTNCVGFSSSTAGTDIVIGHGSGSYCRHGRGEFL